jgi:hypothetical protein
MDRLRSRPSNAGTPELREAVRAQIVRHGHTSSRAIALVLDVPHATVVRILQRFMAVGPLRLAPPPAHADGVVVLSGSLTPRFRDPSLSLW